MSKYLIEIKNRLILFFFASLVTMFVCYLYKEILLFLVIYFCLKLDSLEFYFIFTNIIEVFSVYLDLILFIHFQIFLFFFIYHTFVFLIPAFYNFEYKYLIFYFQIFLFFWFFSILLTNYVLIPISWKFFVSFQTFYFGQSFYFESKLSEYFNFYKSVYYFCIIYCQFFSLLFIFFKDINSKKLYVKKFRKLYYYIFTVFATFICPPDIFSQIILSCCLIFIYEIMLIFFVYFLKIIFLLKN